MDISSIFPSSDNLYKFLFMGGIFMVVFSFVYPLEKQQRIELEINLYNKQIELLNEEIKELNASVYKLKSKTKEALKNLEHCKFEKDEKVAKLKIRNIQNNYNLIFNDTKHKEEDVITKNIVLKYEKEKIQLLKGHVESFFYYRLIFLVIGSLFTLFGLWNWYKSTKISIDMQKLELRDRMNQLNNNTP